ncbi:FecR domain-containing protein [Pseudanabaena biceps]|nr:FecR domain-containing protein [Pseudanabaena biceps]
MLKSPRGSRLLLMFVAFGTINLSAIAMTITCPLAEAQSGIRVRADQWLRVEKVVGNVTYRNLYNYTSRPAIVGDLLQAASDEISTGEGSSATLSVDTGAGLIYVAENTTIRVKSFLMAADSGRITNLFISRGKARLQIRKFTNSSSQLNIQTPAGVSGVRGTEFIVIARPTGDTVLSTLSGRVASMAQNVTEPVRAKFENMTLLGKPPSKPVPIKNDPSLKYTIDRKTSAIGRSVSLIGYTNPFNTVKVDGLEQPLDLSGKFAIQFPAPSTLKVNVQVETPQGKTQFYEIPLL